MIHILLYLTAQAGFILLLLAMARHHQDWLRRKPDPRRSAQWRAVGFGMLALCFLIAGAGFGWGYGAVVWFGWLSVGAALTVALNANRERILARVRS